MVAATKGPETVQAAKQAVEAAQGLQQQPTIGPMPAPATVAAPTAAAAAVSSSSGTASTGMCQVYSVIMLFE